MPPQQNKQPDFIPGPPPPDFIPAPAPTAEPEGFLSSVGNSLGIDPNAERPQHAFRDAAINLVAPGATAIPGMAKSLYEGGKRSLGELGQAGKAAVSGDLSGAAYHGVKSIPILGPGMDKMADQAADNGMGKPGNSYAEDLQKAFTSPGAMGTGLGTAFQGASALEGASGLAGREGIAPIPTRAKAGAVFESLNKDLANQPVNLSKTTQPLQRVTEIGERGGTLPGPVSKFLQRSQMTEPMTFPEARDYQSNLGSMSSDSESSMNGPMRGGVKQLNKAFYNDMSDAAKAGGRGADYEKAMTDYRRASMIRNAAKVAGKAAATGVAGAGAVKLAKDLWQ